MTNQWLVVWHVKLKLLSVSRRFEITFRWTEQQQKIYPPKNCNFYQFLHHKAMHKESLVTPTASTASPKATGARSIRRGVLDRARSAVWALKCKFPMDIFYAHIINRFSSTFRFWSLRSAPMLARHVFCFPLFTRVARNPSWGLRFFVL